MARGVMPISRAMPRSEMAPGPSVAICLRAIAVISRYSSPEYQKALAVREGSMEIRELLVEGVPR
jgi:uncharacterized protein (DUF1330 family)